jgi:branched-chain amino acid transport system substrate-binding protein
VAGIGSWSVKTSPAARAYFDAHVKKFQKEPDRWASAHCWAGLQILQSAIENVGVDRKAIRDYIAANEHATILGALRFKGSEILFPGTVSQWTGGDFEVVWPTDRATAQMVVPKPAWK